MVDRLCPGSSEPYSRVIKEICHGEQMVCWEQDVSKSCGTRFFFWGGGSSNISPQSES